LLNNKITILFNTQKEILMDTTFDWLNNHIYILMFSLTSRMYNIKKFDLEREKLVEIVSGFEYKPIQIEIDPCNG